LTSLCPAAYCYLGLWFNNACNWNTHFEKMLTKVHRVKGGLMPVWKSRLISVEVKRIILLTCMRPIVEYGSEVWFPSTARQVQQIDKAQTDIIKCVVARNAPALQLFWLNGV
jgi:hypothetical protein